MKLLISHSEGPVNLEVSGLPDHSLGHDNETLGIILSWRLQLIGSHVLEGKKENLLNLVYVIQTYSRFLISGNIQTISDSSKTVTLSKSPGGHELILVSSLEKVKPLSIILDDAELSDLTICLDKLTHDNRLDIRWHFVNQPRLLNRSIKRTYRNLIYLISASIVFTATTLAFMFLIPLPTKDLETGVRNDTNGIYREKQ